MVKQLKENKKIIWNVINLYFLHLNFYQLMLLFQVLCLWIKLNVYFHKSQGFSDQL